jgi:asparagine N-glycosylation enzyme membrane subunit Stt3
LTAHDGRADDRAVLVRERAHWVAGVGLAATAAALVLWVRLLPLSLASVPANARDLFRFPGADGHQHVYLGDFDSYLWVRHARNLLRTGNGCDAVLNGQCWDTYANAPIGAPTHYGASFHVTAIAAVHRLLDVIRPGIPLTTSAYWVPVLVGVAGVLPALGIGWRLAGPLAGFVGAIVVGVNPLFLRRSIGGDNDVWNVVLPLFAVWAAIVALETRARPVHRLAMAVLAGALIALHAATWNGWIFTAAVVAAGFGAASVLSVLRVLTGRERARDLGWTLTVAIAFALAGAGGVRLTGTSIDPLLRGVAGALGIAMAAAQTPPSGAAVPWPDIFATVGELARPGLPDIAGTLEGPLYFFVAWLGLLLLLLPERRWQWWHFAILIGGNLLYRYLLSATRLGPTALVGLLALPLLAGLTSAAFDTDDRVRPAGLVVVVWFLAALQLSFSGMRFVMLLVPPFGILFGVAVGRLYAWLVRIGTPHVGVAWRIPAAGTLFAACAAVVIPSVGQGAQAARAYLPNLNDGWWDALTTIRDTTPPNAIVTSWWDFGHWIKFIAERRVTSDGSTLSPRVAHWIGRMLLAPTEREAIGLLRMLDCGSDVGPEGAMARLVAHGVPEPAAYELVLELANLDRDAARTRLLDSGLTLAAADDILAATHCTPPPAYLLLTTRLITTPAWRHLGSFDPRRALAVAASRESGTAGAITALEQTFGLPESAAQSLAERAAGLRGDLEAQEFVSPSQGYLVPGWVGCGMLTSGEWSCPVGQVIDTAGTVLETVLYRPDAPETSRLRLRGRAGTFDAEPAALLVASTDRIDEIALAHPGDERMAVLIDLPGRRVLIGPPRLLRSIFTQLVFLDGRTAPAFEKTDVRELLGERIVTWRVRNPEDRD